MSQAKRCAEFQALHASGCFVIPNPWDIGSARMLAALGAKALATTSSGYAITLGLPDGAVVTRDQMLQHAADIVGATALPVSADLENGYGEAPEVVAETVRLAAEAGLAGCSIEDTDLPGSGAYAFDLTVERIRAAVDAVRGLGLPFMLTARADGLLTGAYDTDEAIRRLQAFEAVGANVLYAPLPPDMAAQARICASATLPVNALAAGRFTSVSLAEFARAGVRRVSVGGALARVAQRAVHDAAVAMLGSGDFTALGGALPGSVIEKLLAAGAAH
ncbi:MAG TPA: isocitrate lyase/phosphoenolpyruvate mutase family protein [Thermohalobaculum sp.]|nr:isocitrate lyase/phosphoenolpyruvate mutase family protein [Thermohalobaculum sp.]